MQIIIKQNVVHMKLIKIWKIQQIVKHGTSRKIPKMKNTKINVFLLKKKTNKIYKNVIVSFLLNQGEFI